MIGLFQENGPCFVHNDSISTYLNPWSWNNEVNMLYIDQPNQVGFSYDKLTNVTLNTLTEDGNEWSVANFSDGFPEQNNTFYIGTTSTQSQQSSANSTLNAARSLWHFAQVWFQEFPEYKPNDDRVSIWTESYGGRYGPAFTAFFQEQNEKIKNGTITEEGTTHPIHLDTLGIINGCVDLLTQALSYPQFAYNNTYGIEAINETVYQASVHAFEKEGGCRDLITKCHTLAAEGDPHMYGNNVTVNEACQKADEYCVSTLEGPYFEYGNRGYYDIGHRKEDPFPPNYYLGYLSQAHVQEAMGVPVNFSRSSDGTYQGFAKTGDYPRGGYLEDLAYILDSGIKVSLVYGDRDYACNWIGGEEVSLAVNYTDSAQFRSAGYADIKTNDSFVGGQVRQYGNFSFVRVFQAGHEVPSYQPETSLEIFRRVQFNKDIATGKIDLTSKRDYSTSGSATTFQVKNEPPENPPAECYILDLGTCTKEQRVKVKNGTTPIKNYILMEDETTSTSTATATATGTGTAPSSTAPNAGARTGMSMGFLSLMVMILSISFS